MNAVAQINQRLQLLPAELQKEVLQFIDYLLFKEKYAESKPSNGDMVNDEKATYSPPPEPSEIDYREFWGIIHPPMGIEKIDQLI